jgi:prepilin-type N-terminal cleavage/methylation domain-containing protein
VLEFRPVQVGLDSLNIVVRRSVTRARTCHLGFHWPWIEGIDRKTRGFTLIKLLAVIAIIAVLMAIMLPALI